MRVYITIPKKVCSVDHCDELSLTHKSGMCQRHYAQIREHGEIFITARDRRKPVILEDHKYYLLHDGRKALFDLDFEPPQNTSPRGHSQGYVRFGEHYAHRLVMNAPDGMEVDHINGDRLDNRKQNLRLAKHEQNMWNKPPTKANKTGVVGVHRNSRGKWVAQVSIGGKAYHVGTYEDKDQAVSSRDNFALKLHGEFAWLNQK